MDRRSPLTEQMPDWRRAAQAVADRIEKLTRRSGRTTRGLSKAERMVLASLVREIAERGDPSTNIRVTISPTEDETAHERLSTYARTRLPQPERSRRRKNTGELAYGVEWSRGFSSRLSHLLKKPIDVRDGIRARLRWEGGERLSLWLELFDQRNTALTPPKLADHELPLPFIDGGVEAAADITFVEAAWTVLRGAIRRVHPDDAELHRVVDVYYKDFQLRRARRVLRGTVTTILVLLLGGCGIYVGRQLSPMFRRQTDRLWQKITRQTPPPSSPPPQKKFAPSPPPRPPRIRHAVTFLRSSINTVTSACEYNTLSNDVHWTPPQEAQLPFFILRNDEVVARIDRLAPLRSEGQSQVYVDTAVEPRKTYCYALAVLTAKHPGEYLAGTCFATTTPACDPTNHPPVASDLELVSDETEAPQRVTVSVNAFDLDHDELTYTWNFGDTWHPVVTRAPEVDHVFYNGGRFDVYLTVSDGRGGTKFVSTVVAIAGDPAPADPTPQSYEEPTPEQRWYGGKWASVVPNEGTMAETVFTFTATPPPLESESGGRPVRYRWFFEDCYVRSLWSRGQATSPTIAGISPLPFDATCAVEAAGPVIQHTFSVPGPLDVQVEIVYDTGEITSRYLGAVQVNPDDQWVQWWTEHPSACGVCAQPVVTTTFASSPPQHQ